MSIVKNTPNILKHPGLSFTKFLNKTIESIADPGMLGIYAFLVSRNFNSTSDELEQRLGKDFEYVKHCLNTLEGMGLTEGMK